MMTAPPAGASVRPHDPIDDVLKAEGGFVNHAADRGGPTNFGITQATLAAWRGKPVTVDDVRSMTEAEARAIYQRRYVQDPGFDRIEDAPLRHLLIDGGVHSGPATAARWLQQALGVTADGKIGPVTMAAANRASPDELYRRVLANRLRHVGRLITRDPKQAVFAEGWANRLAKFLEA